MIIIKTQKQLIWDCCKEVARENSCVCNHIHIIESFLYKNYKNCLELPPIKVGSLILNYKSLNSFNISIKKDNDKNNKYREKIIYSILNNIIPEEYYSTSTRWKTMRDSIYSYIYELTGTQPYSLLNNIKCEQKGGRLYNYDFLIKYGERQYCVELKFNASSIKQAPQFSSPMNPSKYLSNNFEEYFYDNYLPLITNNYNLIMPEKEVYCKEVQSPEPHCMRQHQLKYYKGCKQSSKFTGEQEDIAYYNLCKNISKKAITEFIENTELNSQELTTYLLNTQKNKVYMLYKDNKFHLERICMDDYIITNVKKEPKKSRFIAETKTNKKLKILLRWKNGNGIAYPAFQIS
jgi:hypothetical protein